MAKEAMSVPGLNMQEVGKEIFGHLGYSDGLRFFTTDNPQVAQLQMQLQQMSKQMQEMDMKLKDKMATHQVKVATTQHTNQTKKDIAALHEDAENLRNAVTHTRALVEAERQQRHEAMMAGIGHGHTLEQSDQQHDSKMTLQNGLQQHQSKAQGGSNEKVSKPARREGFRVITKGK